MLTVRAGGLLGFDLLRTANPGPEFFPQQYLSADYEIRDSLTTSLIIGLHGRATESQLDRSLYRGVFRDFGETTLYGHCLATNEEITQAGRQAAAGDMGPLTNLAGNFSGVLFTDKLAVAFGGLSGQFPLYYGHTGTKVALSERASFVEHWTNADLDRASLAAQIGLPQDVLRETYSSFEGVRKLGAGEMLRIERSGLSKSMYETFAPAPDGNIEKAALATREAIGSVLAKLLEHYDLNSDFSSGYDSSSLAYKAASLDSRVIDALVHYHPDYAAGDIAYARYLAHSSPSINLHEIEETDADLPFSILSPRSLPYDPSEPCRNTSLRARLLRRQVAMNSLRSSGYPLLHLTGTGGDALYDSRLFLADLLTGDRPQPDRLLGDGIRVARLNLGVPAAYMQQAYNHAGLTLSQAWERLAEVLTDPSKKDEFDVGWLPDLSRNLDWLTPEVRRLLRERALATAEEAQTDLNIGDYCTIRQIGDSGDAQRHFGEPHRVHAPYLYHEVIRAALQCSAYERTRPGLPFKAVLRNALSRHGVPPELFERRTKGDYSLAAAAGLRRAQAGIHMLLQHSRLDALGIIEPKVALDALYRHEIDGKGKAYFAPLVAAEVWLRQREVDTGKYIGRPPFSVEPSGETILSQKLVPTESIACAAGPAGQMVLLDVDSGKIAYLDKTEARILRTLTETRDPEHAIWRLAEEYPNVSFDTLRHETVKKIKHMIQQGWITHEGDKNALLPILRSLLIEEWVPFDEDALKREHERLSRRELIDRRPATLAELRLARELLHEACNLSTKELSVILGAIREARAPAAYPRLKSKEAGRLQSIARQVSHEAAFKDQRVACYELSLTTVFMAAASKYCLDWVIGVAFEPQPVIHAWASSGDRPVVTKNDEPVRGRFMELWRQM